MALTDKDMVIACAPNRAAPSGKVLLRVANSNSDKFPTREFQWDVRSDGGSSSSSMIKIDIDATKHEWSNYFLSGFKVELRM